MSSTSCDGGPQTYDGHVSQRCKHEESLTAWDLFILKKPVALDVITIIKYRDHKSI